MEAGYCWFPEIYDLAIAATGNVEPGTYLYCVTYEQRDTRGQDDGRPDQSPC